MTWRKKLKKIFKAGEWRGAPLWLWAIAIVLMVIDVVGYTIVIVLLFLGYPIHFVM